MKITILTIIFIAFFATVSYSQTVEVSQEYVDNATKAFTEVKALRDKVAELENARKVDNDSIIELTTNLKIRTAELVKAEAENVRVWARLDLLLGKSRKKCWFGCVQIGNE